MTQMRYRTRLRQLKLEKAMRMGKEITYQDVAEATGLSYQTVHRYATKVIPRPDYETVVKLANYFQVPVEEFMLAGREEADEGQLVAVLAG